MICFNDGAKKKTKHLSTGSQQHLSSTESFKVIEMKLFLNGHKFK